MKRTVFFIGIMLFGLAVNAQTGIYKHFAKRPNVRVYCVERYPLAMGDTACVTLLEANDSVTYKALRKELKAFPFTPKKNYNLYVPFVNPLEDSLSAKIKPQHRDRKNSLEGFTLDGIDGDDGYYMVYCPSDRYVILAFLGKGIDDQIKVMFHMLATEF